MTHETEGLYLYSLNVIDLFIGVAINPLKCNLTIGT